MDDAALLASTGHARAGRRIALVGICLGYALVILDANVLNVAAPALQLALGASAEGLLWIIDGYTLAFAGLLLTAGALGDRLGARRVLLAGLLLFTLASLTCSLVGSAVLLIPGRIGQGVGAALLAPTSLALLRDLYPEKTNRARALGVWSAISGIVFALGPVIGGGLVDTVGWQSIFLLNLPVGGLAIALVMAATSNDLSGSSDAAAPFDAASQALAMVALASLTFALIETSVVGWRSSRVLIGFAASLVAGLGALWREAGKPDAARLVSLAALRVPALRAGLCSGAAFNFCLYGALLALTLYLQEARHLSPLATGAVFLPLTAVHAVVAAWITGGLTAARGPRLPLALGLCFSAAGTGAIALVATVTNAPGLAAILLGLGVFGIGSGLTTAPLTELVLANLPECSMGVGSGVLNATRQVGGLVGIALLGSLTIAHPASGALGAALATAAAVALLAMFYGLASTRGEN